MIRVKIDSKLRILIGDLPGDSLKMLMAACEIPNIEKEDAKRFGQYGWQSMPDHIKLWDIDEVEDELVLPRGYQAALREGFAAFEETPRWSDQRSWFPHGIDIGTPIILHDWQGPQVEAILYRQEGIIKAPAGSGKTVSVIAAIQRLKCNALIIVNTKDILWQWQDRAEQFLGEEAEIGQVGDGIFLVSPHITIATAQTIHSRFDALKAKKFFDSFSFVCLDECHHATAETYNRIMNEFSAVYRIGVSATPDKTGQFELATKVIGEIVHETLPSEVKNLEMPEVVKIVTNFDFAMKGSGRSSNYQSMISALTKDLSRNSAIVQNIMNNVGHHQLVISKRLGHLEAIRQMLEDNGFLDPVVTIIGENDSAHRKEAKELAENSPCVVLSTLADEAMDIKKLDRLHLIYPQKNTGLIVQQVGRIMRKHPDKVDSIVYDYCDIKVGILKNQFKKRRWEVYEPAGYVIKTWNMDNL